MVLVDIGIHPEHVQVIRSNIGPESVAKRRDVQMSQFAPISGKKHGYSLRPVFQTPQYFLEVVDSIYETFYK
jgi:hypothetical protein